MIAYRLFASLAALALGVCAGCNSASPPSADGREQVPAPAVITPDMRDAVEGNTSFALDMYAHLAKKPGNVFFSPFSLSTALAMTYGGARGETAEQMAKTLHFTLPQGRLHAAMGALIVSSPSESKPPYELHVANALWGQQGYPFLPEFTAEASKHYGAGLREVDFARATEEARRTINAWVGEHTQNKIKDLIPPGVLDRLTRLVLTNAIYFKGSWAHRFDPKNTVDQPFFVAAAKSHPVPLMHQDGKFKFFRGAGCRVLEMPYTGGDVAMVVVLPDKVDGLADLEKGLEHARLKKYLAELREQKVRVYLPRFRMLQAVVLKDALSEMGMPVAFSPSQADFAGIAGKSKKLFISQVIHKAFVEVNEEGTEAAAATAVVVGEKAVAPRPETFRADHPFLFLIRDLRTGGVLFLGRVADARTE